MSNSTLIGEKHLPGMTLIRAATRAGCIRLLIGAALMTAMVVPAVAGTIVQTYTRTQDFTFPGPLSGYFSLIPASFFDVTFEPFVGPGLTSAVISIADDVSGTLNPGSPTGSGTVSDSTALALNGTNFTGGGNGHTMNGVSSPTPFSFSTVISADLLGTFPALLNGTSPLVFAQAAGPGAHAFSNIDSLDMSVTFDATLTYTFDGAGALYGAPEPASFSLLGFGLAFTVWQRRRRQA